MSIMVDVVGVHKTFGTLEVLHDVSLEVRVGAVTVILGPSGRVSPRCSARSTISRRSTVG